MGLRVAPIPNMGLIKYSFYMLILSSCFTSIFLYMCISRIRESKKDAQGYRACKEQSNAFPHWPLVQNTCPSHTAFPVAVSQRYTLVCPLPSLGLACTSFPLAPAVSPTICPSLGYMQIAFNALFHILYVAPLLSFSSQSYVTPRKYSVNHSYIPSCYSDDFLCSDGLIL